MGRSIAAVGIGLLNALALVVLQQMVLWFAIEGADDVRLALNVAAVFVSALLSGFITAAAVGHAEVVHGLALGTALLAVLAVNALAVEPDRPPWYQLAFPAAGLPAAPLGAYLRARTKRPPPDQSPKAP